MHDIKEAIIQEIERFCLENDMKRTDFDNFFNITPSKRRNWYTKNGTTPTSTDLSSIEIIQRSRASELKSFINVFYVLTGYEDTTTAEKCQEEKILQKRVIKEQTEEIEQLRRKN